MKQYQEEIAKEPREKEIIENLDLEQRWSTLTLQNYRYLLLIITLYKII